MNQQVSFDNLDQAEAVASMQLATPRKRIAVSIAERFGLKDVPAKVKTEAMEPSDDPFIPPRNEGHVFDKVFVREVLAFLRKPEGDALYIFGPTGSGKTSGITQMLSRLNWPVQQITAHGRMQFGDLMGQFVMRADRPGEAPQMRWVDGPLTTAMRKGHVLLINEVDLIDPAELSGLNDVLEGCPLVIAENGGEVVKPHPDFRVVVTGNSSGSGDATGLYPGIMVQNIAALDRYRFIEVDYPEKAVELDILSKITPDTPEVIIAGMVEVANHIRNVFKGNDPKVQLGVTLSTRTLCRWARMTVDFRSAANPLAYALDQALLRRANPEERTAILRICKDVFGDQWQ